MAFDFTVVWNNLDYLLWGRTPQGEIGGLLLSVLIALGAGSLALVLGVGLALLAWFKPGPVRRLLFAGADLIRGIPLIFVIFWIYFLLPALFNRPVPNVLSVILALAAFTGAAVMHTTLAGLQALPRGLREAGLASGLSEIQVVRLILLPPALRNLVPSYVGLFVSLIKDTSLAFIVNVPDLTTVATQVNSRTLVYAAEIFLATGVLYYVLCAGLAGIVRLLGGDGARPRERGRA
ncbi:amino acid ABC transporter permease [Pararhodospirillum photometricum]|nr:amino acid ABC transporter permease [Pararhodospirillum photometricum]